MKPLFLFPLLLICLHTTAQKKTLDHTVYDNWKSIGEKMISNDGRYVVYTVNPQEGDGELVIQNPYTRYKKAVPRGYGAVITEDSRWLIFKIKPLFKDTRKAKIQKKKAADMPKDSLGIIGLGKDSVLTAARIKSFKTPEKGADYIAYQLEKPLADAAKKKAGTDSAKTKYELLMKLADSMIRVSIDSIKGNITNQELTEIINKASGQIIKKIKNAADADEEDTGSSTKAEGTDLVVKKTGGKEILFKWVTEYYFDKDGTRLLMETTKNSKDSNSNAMVLLYHLQSGSTDTLMTKLNDVKNFVFDEAGNQLAFVAERDSSEKALLKFYKLWYYTTGNDTAAMIVDKHTTGMQLGYTVSEHAKIEFSKDGSKLYFGNAPVRPPKDTTLVDIDLVKLDVWHYKDDYLQPQQLKKLDSFTNQSYTAVYHISDNKLLQLGDAGAEKITLVNDGNANWVLAETDKGSRIEAQWMGKTKSAVYAMNTITGERKKVFTGVYAEAHASPAGKFVYWYDAAAKNYFTYEIATGITRNVSAKIKLPLYDVENDVPDVPDAYGVMGWHQADRAMYIYDQFDVWKISPDGAGVPSLISVAENNSHLKKTASARKKSLVTRWIALDKDFRFFSFGKKYFFTLFNKANKQQEIIIRNLNEPQVTEKIIFDNKKLTARYAAAKNGSSFIFSQEDFQHAPNLFFTDVSNDAAISLNSNENSAGNVNLSSIQLSDINPQQKEYNWGTAGLFSWKTYTGKTASGILYKPEDFDPKKKYPLICYFYDRHTDDLYKYISPAPTPSRLNISFYVSRGYIVFSPDIFYTTGHPGNDAYNYVVSGARALAKTGIVDITKIGIQGQSWGGYQVAYLITRTKLFKAAWAGAPVANMTSAYGGMRWESGLNRQFQYEKQQSRIGATLWQKPQLYIQNSPLFYLPNVQTPLVIMANDADGAVPWYQGIELFTGLRRLGKPVWMLNYNGEAHNLVERKNRKDIQIRQQQFFDWQLKGAEPVRWLTDGVPAVDKGKDWGL